MKTRIILMLFFFAPSVIVYNQNLSDFYKKDVIQLEPQSDFARNINWEELYTDYGSIDNFGRSLGQRKKIVVAPDGSVFMSHKTLHEIWKFDNSGNLVTKFGKKGGKPGQFVYLPNVEGILDRKYLFTSDVQGRLNFFDLNGKFVKLVKLDYVPRAIVPLINQKIAILGHVPWKGGSRSILRIKDINTGAEKEIWQEFRPYNSQSIITIEFPHGGMRSHSVPYLFPNFQLATSKKGNLILASPNTGDIKEYDPDGNLLNSFKLNITPKKVTDEDINGHYEQALKSIETFEKSGLKSIERTDSIVRKVQWTDSERKEVLESYKKQVENYKDRKFYPEYLPYFSSLIVDSDGNLLVFEYTQNKSNKFRAYTYDMKGNFIGTSSFNNEAFNFLFTPSTFQFNNGFVYAVAFKNADKISPPQIVKMKLQ